MTTKDEPETIHLSLSKDEAAKLTKRLAEITKSTGVAVARTAVIRAILFGEAKPL